MKTGVILQWVDSVIRYEEYLAEALASVVDASDSAYCNLATQVDGRICEFAVPEASLPGEASVDERYVVEAACRPENAVMQLMLVGNKCFYGKCAFCIQINKHLQPGFRDPAAAIDEAMQILRRYRRLGVRTFSLMDEALRPKDIRLFCERLTAEGLDITWVGRTVAAKGFSHVLLRDMAAAGCQEILFGLETIDPATAKAMGKINQRATKQDIVSLVEDFGDAGIDLVLSMIHSFPTETPESREELFEFCAEIDANFNHVSFILNRFALFCNTPLFNAPERVGVVSIGRRLEGNDLQITFNYKDSAGRIGFEPVSDAVRVTGAQYGLCERDVARFSAAPGPVTLPVVGHLDYASFGLLHRQAHGRYLRRDMLVYLDRATGEPALA